MVYRSTATELAHQPHHGNGNGGESLLKIREEAPPARSREFLLEEYKSLRSEAADLRKTSSNLEMYAAGACAAIFAWIGTQGAHSPQQEFIWWIPLILTLLGAWRAYAIAGRSGEFSKYLAEIEETFGVNGWEHQSRPQTGARSGKAFWATLIAATFIGANMGFGTSAEQFWTAGLVVYMLAVIAGSVAFVWMTTGCCAKSTTDAELSITSGR